MERLNKWARKMVLAAVVVAASVGMVGCKSELQKAREEGIRQYQAKEYDQSLVTLKRALSYDKSDAVSNAYAGLILYEQGKLQQAEYHLRLALDFDPSSEVAKAGLTTVLIKQGKPDEALNALERAAVLAEKVDDPRRDKSNLKNPYTKEKEVQERLFTGKLRDRVRIARAYQMLGDYDNALVYYKKALEMSPKDANVLMSVADMAERAGNKVQAREYLRQAYLADPATPGLVDAMTRNGLAISDVSGTK